MGYQVNYKLTKEQLQEKLPLAYGKDFDVDESIEDLRTELTIAVMKDSENVAATSVSTMLRFFMNSIARIVEESEKQYKYKQFEEYGRVWTCGWDMLHESPYDEDCVVSMFIRKLVILATRKTPDFLDEEERFNKYQEKIEEVIDEFIDACRDVYAHKVVEALAEFKEPEKDLKAELITGKQAD